MAASGPLPVTQDLSTLRAKLQKLLRFLREALPISNAHTVDFYTESVWEKLVDLPPETVLSALRTFAAASEACPLEEAGRMSGEWLVGGAGKKAGRDPGPWVASWVAEVERTRAPAGSWQDRLLRGRERSRERSCFSASWWRGSVKRLSDLGCFCISIV